MSHCPQCGEPPPEGARACPFCGFLFAAIPRSPAAPAAHAPASRTIVGVSVGEVAPSAPAGSGEVVLPRPAAPAGMLRASRTIVGMPASALPRAAAAPASAASPGAAAAKGAAPLRVGQTIVGMVAGVPQGRGEEAILTLPKVNPAPAAGSKPIGGTLLGVALPGIAPLAPGQVEAPVAKAAVATSAAAGHWTAAPAAEPPPPGYEPARELGATMGPAALSEAALAQVRDKERDRRRRRMMAGQAAGKLPAVRAPREEDRASRRALWLVLAAGALALGAVLVALFWPSPPPLTARARADASGREGVELVCKSCPDGTKLTIAGAAATTTGGTALVPIPTALSVGENRFRVDIDRPGNGRDETVNVSVNVAYRIRPDLATLQADRPAFQILAEVAGGTTVTIDGRPMALSGGRGAENVDVTEVCTGLSAEVKTLSRQIPYVVTPESGPAEQGVVNVSVGIVPLRLEAPVAMASPTPHVITDGPSFVLAGSTIKGAEVLAAGRPITVHPDGSFAQVMNVSSVGATQIEVRARMPGMAPRLTQIKVRRVDSLEKAARDLASTDPPIPFGQLTSNIAAAVGKAVALTGEVSETKKQGYETVMLLEVSTASGCAAAPATAAGSGAGSSCTVRLVQGADNPAKRGDVLRVYGHVARAFSVPGRADIPEIEVDFTLKGEGGGGVKERR